MYTALALVLDFVKELLPFLNMPQGGSINIALIPVVLASFHLGVKNGLVVGALWWAISSLMGLNSWFISILQYVIDYVIPSIIIGAAAIFYKHKSLLEAELGILLVMLLRTLSVVLSGVYFWPSDAAAGSVAAWSGSLAYNLPYSIATTIMLMVIVPLVLKRNIFKTN